MTDKTMTALEFPGLLCLLQEYAFSSLGKTFLAGLTPLADLSLIQGKFQELKELQDWQNREGPPPLRDFPALSLWLAKATVPGSLLPPLAFNEILSVLRLSHQLRLYLLPAGPARPCLAGLAARLTDLPNLREAIVRSISPHNFILDQASPALARVRQELASTRELINRQIKQAFFTPSYQDIIQTPTISQRHGRYVIPLKADHKGAIPGIIHDQSQTRATLYLEPLAIVEQNNALNLLSNQEKREEEAVLRRLTDLVREVLPALHANLATLAELDAIQAKVRFSRDYQAREPEFRSSGGLDFRQARHPLLLKRAKEQAQAFQVVPVDLELTPTAPFLVISGANAGGKTVALKTMGLLTLMIQSGIPVPVAEGSAFSPFDQIFADIGDLQNLQQDLSTFSAHLKQALDMLSALSGRALILLDELGTATDPVEGGALALSLLKAFYQRGAYGAVTTHLPLLKSFAQQEPGFRNAAVIFDEETHKPTYRLAYGLPGASNALKIARQLGLDHEILTVAESYLNREELQAYRLLHQVEAAQQTLALKEAELAKTRTELAAQLQELANLRQTLALERRTMQQDLEKRARELIHQAEGEFRTILRRLQRQEAPWGALRQELSARAQRLLNELSPAAGQGEPPTLLCTPGMQVFLPALNLTGEVISGPDRDGRLLVRVRKVRLRVRPEEVTCATAVPSSAETWTVPSYQALSASSPSLNLVGLRVEEALPLVDRLLDQAVLHGQERVDIIHGMGTGRLKQAVWQHLKQHTMVRAIRGDVNPGITVVDLKD